MDKNLFSHILSDIILQNIFSFTIQAHENVPSSFILWMIITFMFWSYL